MNSSTVPPKAEPEGDQAPYRENIRLETVVVSRCASYLRAKSPSLITEDSTEYDDVALRRLFDSHVEGKKSNEEAFTLTVKFARTAVETIIRRAEIIVSQRLNKIERVYFSKLRKYGDRYGLTADAVSEFEIRTQRSVLLDADAVIRKSLEDPKCSVAAWSGAVEGYLTKINEVAELASKLSKQKLEWEKLIDDKRRLRAAIRGLWLAVILSGLALAYDAYKDCAAASGPSVCVLVENLI